MGTPVSLEEDIMALRVGPAVPRLPVVRAQASQPVPAPVVDTPVKPAAPDITGMSGLKGLFGHVRDLWHKVEQSAVFQTLAKLSNIP
jgi:hypothetical protein